MRIIFAIDPGSTTAGIVLYDWDAHRVQRCNKAADEELVYLELQRLVQKRRCGVKVEVVIEQVSAGGYAANSFLETQFLAGAFYGWCQAQSLPVSVYYRRDVLSALNCHAKGRSRDSQVRAALIELHGGSSAIGKKATPGPLYGVTSHAWQALGVVIAHAGTWRSDG